MATEKNHSFIFTNSSLDKTLNCSGSNCCMNEDNYEHISCDGGKILGHTEKKEYYGWNTIEKNSISSELLSSMLLSPRTDHSCNEFFMHVFLYTIICMLMFSGAHACLCWTSARNSQILACSNRYAEFFFGTLTNIENELDWDIDQWGVYAPLLLFFVCK